MRVLNVLPNSTQRSISRFTCVATRGSARTSVRCALQHSLRKPLSLSTCAAIQGSDHTPATSARRSSWRRAPSTFIGGLIRRRGHTRAHNVVQRFSAITISFNTYAVIAESNRTLATNVSRVSKVRALSICTAGSNIQTRDPTLVRHVRQASTPAATSLRTCANTRARNPIVATNAERASPTVLR